MIALSIAKDNTQPTQSVSPLRRFCKRVFVSGITLTALALILLAAYITFWPFELKTPERTTNVLADDGQLLTSIYVENRRPVPLADVSPNFLDAVIAVEDSRFYKHRGIDFIRLGKAILVNIQTRSKAQGASTLTQQLARNLYLTLEKKYTRKIQEAVLALQIEQHLGKDEILELYVNQIYYGHGLYGIQNAAQFYYGKDADDLTLAQATMLAGVIRVPEVYSPINDFAASRKRQRVVLNRLVAVGKLSQEEADVVFEREQEVRP
ncbi:MAG TPA: carboxypeptidase, partial [Firmicutes bacterium]|nr:carboxypeptidase [Bacillota bacterium]